jgi:ABC-type glycerol-3-phosphate transport system substrate-binding protein
MGNSFLIDTWCVGKNYLGTKDWTFETMKELYKNQSKQQVFLYNIDRESFLREMILGGIDNFVNWETGEVSIDSDEFMDILELSTYIPSNEDTDIEEVDLKKTIKKGNLIAMECSLYQCSDIELFSQFYKKAGGAEIAGYPSKNSGNAISIRFFNPAMAITQQCEDKEGAWEFLRYFLTFEKQLSYATGENDVGFPVRKDAFEKMLEYAMAKESYTDENGVEITPIDSSYNYYGCEIPIGPISEEEADQIRDVVDRIGTVTTENDVVSTQIMDIVQEEAGAFYAGDKTAKEVAEIIQSRIKLFVSENS